MFGSPKSLPSKCLGVQRPTLTRYDWMSKVSSCTPKKLGSQYIDFRVVYTLIRKRSLIGTPRKAKFSGNWTVSSKIYRELKGVHRKFANNYKYFTCHPCLCALGLQQLLNPAHCVQKKFHQPRFPYISYILR